MSSVGTISSGLDSRKSKVQGVTVGPATDLENKPVDYTGVPTDLDSIKQLNIEVAEVSETFKRKLGKLDNQLKATQAELDRSADSMGLDQQTRQQHIDKALKDHRRKLEHTSETERMDYIRRLQDFERRANLALKLYPTPVALLEAAGLGSEERSRYLEQLQHAGPTTLLNLAAQAQATGNRVLGAALVSVLDRMPRERRPVSAQAVAENLVGTDHRQIQATATAAKNRLQEALEADRVFRGARPRAVQSVRNALDRQKEAALFGDGGDGE